MAVLSDLVKSLAQVEGLEENQVAWVGRYLREAGHITQGGRGRGGAQMSTPDAIQLIIGLNASPSPKDAPAAAKAFAELDRVDVLYPLVDDGDELSAALLEPADAVSCLTKLLNVYVNAGREVGGYTLEIAFNRPNLSLHIWVGYRSTNPEEADEPICALEFSSSIDQRQFGDRKDQTTISQATFIAVAETLRN